MELSLKRLDRYPPIFRSYITDPDRVNVVLYLCGTRSVYETLCKLAGEHRRFYFGLWTDFQAGPEDASFGNRYDRVSLKEIA
jgi:hypothetical protein